MYGEVAAPYHKKPLYLVFCSHSIVEVLLEGGTFLTLCNNENVQNYLN